MRIVFKKIKQKSKAKKHVSVKRVRDINGEITTVTIVDVGSQTLPDDLRYVFSKNVSRARKDNRRKIGSSDLGFNGA